MIVLKNISRVFILLIVSGLFIMACSKNPYRSTNKMYKQQVKSLTKTIGQYPLKDSSSTAPYFVGTTNFNLRKPNFVVIHHTAQNSCEQTLKTFTMTKTQVSAHYVICKDGTVHHMLNDYLRAWHGGAGKWGNNTDINSSSIGIELDNNGSEIFPEMQIQSLLKLLAVLKKNHSVPAANFIGHSDIAPGRKVDPSRFFPWQKLSAQGFGLWYDTTGVKLPENFDHVQALRIIGYDVKDINAAILSFKIHFVPEDKSKTLSDVDKKILFVLSRKY
jgi:N-acetylmuramoyl-L-alanine amidase